MKQKTLLILGTLGLASTVMATCYYNVVMACAGSLTLKETVTTPGGQEVVTCSGITTDNLVMCRGTSSWASSYYASSVFVPETCWYTCSKQDSYGNWHTLMDTITYQMPVAQGVKCPQNSGT
jgi:hypothetical protein